MILDQKKYENVILFLTKHIGNGMVRGKKKIYKLLYYIDFDSFERNETPITGEVYHKLPMGPAPSYFDSISTEMEKLGKLKIAKSKTAPGMNDAYIYQGLQEPDLSVFNKEDLKILKRVVKLYGNKSGKQLEELTHNEAPFLAVEVGEEMPLELALYRGTTF